MKAQRVALIGLLLGAIPVANIGAQEDRRANAPWDVRITTAPNPIVIGNCAPVTLAIVDPVTKESPRDPTGVRISVKDFDITVSAPQTGAIATQTSGANFVAVCGCQAAAVGTVATITARYPANALSAKARIAGVDFQTTQTISLAAARSSFDQPECQAVKTVAVRGSGQVVSGSAPVPMPTTTSAPVPVPVASQPLNPKTPLVTPIPVNPGGLTAKQTGDAQVQLTWQPVSGVSYYLVLGPGSSNGGVRVSGTTAYAVSGAPTGPQTWLVGSYYDPDPLLPSGGVGPNAISTPATAFTKVLLTVTAPIVAAPATARHTTLNPAINGFRFVNSFTNSFIGPPVSMQTSGLCGGMSYAVLDWFNAGQTIPKQNFRPANGTTIQQYLYGRQVTSLTQNLDKWAETSVNPFGSRTTEFFNWGLNERLHELQTFIDRNAPVPLGLKGTGAGVDHDHQVLAIGYDLGRYKGDLGAFKEELKIFILDPNYPNETVTLVPNVAANEFYEVEHPTSHWRTYFVDGRYARMTPPTIVNPTYPNDGLVHELLFDISTGQDDMRGGADHVDVTIKFSNNTSQFYPNVSQDGRWLSNYSESVQLILTQPVAIATIKTIEISTNAAGGLNGDNWDLLNLQVEAIGSGFSKKLLTRLAGPWRFTGARLPLVIPIP